MRRTYRSKKDTTGTLDHRDVLQNLAEKSSAFDAFYIQNIKQTKRELSCVSSSNQLGISSNKVRKRKYVKRVIKDVETVKQRETMSPTAFLTPDKSFRVNKLLDPFDMLLISSPTCQQPESTAPVVKKDVFDTLQPKKESKTYIRKKGMRAKKINYSSSDSYDSEKENSSAQCNVTDIRAHKLLIEKEANISPNKKQDESINKILNNISLINNIKKKTSINSKNSNKSSNSSFKFIRDRLSRDIHHSPILQKSPLCSTPFKDKYRGQSIYNFSPITIKSDSPNYVTITEENDCNKSIIFVPKLSKSKSHNKSSQIQNEISKVYDEIAVNSNHNEASIKLQNSVEIEDKSIVKRDEENLHVNVAKVKNTDTIVTVEDNENNNMSIINKDSEMNNSEHNEKDNKSGGAEMTSMNSTEIENLSLQKTDAAPFLGFSKDNEGTKQSPEKTNTNSSELTTLQNTETELLLGFSRVNQSLTDLKKYLGECLESIVNSINDDDNSYIESDKIDNSNNDMSTSEFVDENSYVENDKIENSYIESDKIHDDVSKSEILDDNSYLENDKSDHSNESLQDTVNSKDDNENSYTESDKSHDGYNKSESSNENSTSTQESDEESMYDTCSDMSDNNVEKEPIVAIERMDNDLFMKYFNKMQAKTDENEDSFSNNSSFNSLNTETYDVKTKANAIIITDSDDVTTSNDDDNNSIEESCDDGNNSIEEEEDCISFVTTRRRHEIANNSMFLFDNSFESNSTDCDKTVVSNQVNLERKSLSLNGHDKKVDGFDDNRELDKELEKVTSRKSSRLTRQSNVDLYSSSVDVIVKDADERNTGHINNEFKDPNNLNKETDRQSSITVRKTSAMLRNSHINSMDTSRIDTKPSIVLQPGKKWERSLSIYRRMTTMADHFDQSLLDDENLQAKGRKYRQSVISTMEMQDSLHNETIISRRSTFISKPSRPTIRLVKDTNDSRVSLNSTNATVYDDFKGFLNEECDDTVIELSKLSLGSEHEVTVLDTFHDTERVTTAKDYVLRRCNQTDPILFDECYPETILKNCHKIGEGVYGEVFLYRGWDGRARVMKIVPIAGLVKVNGEQQKDFHEIISEIVIAMELSALRAPIAEINRQFDEGKDVDAIDLPGVENATDVFNEVLAVRCVYGAYPSRLLDLWELYDECKGSENDNPAALPIDQQYIVLELANAGQDLESYQFASAQQAHALFQQIAFGLAVGEEAFQFEHRDLHWGNVLIAPTEQKYASFVLRNRVFRVPRCGVAATIIDYSLSRVSLELSSGGEQAQLYNDLAHDEQLFDAVGDYQFQVYRLMRDKLGNEWKNFEPYTNILWLHYTVDKMITALRYKRTNTKIHKHYIEKLKGIKERILDYGSATLYVLTDNEI